MKNLKLDLLTGLVQTYGAKLYEQGDSLGTVTVGEEGVTIEDNTLVIPHPEGTMYIAFRQDVVAEEGKTYELHIFIAQRDANGTFNDKPWSVAKGSKKVFAS